eukprot:9493911-Pyramimonas_sp.AAC.1
MCIRVCNVHVSVRPSGDLRPDLARDHPGVRESCQHAVKTQDQLGVRRGLFDRVVPQAYGQGLEEGTLFVGEGLRVP